jgi:dTDP-4-dehydrorhamnose 3,5-epimerase
MFIKHTKLKGVCLIDLKNHSDNRGHFMETYQKERYYTCGIDFQFVQDNRVYSCSNVLRGLHYQISEPFAQLVQVTTGKIFEVAVDLRQNSKTFGQHIELVLDAKLPQQLILPPGVAHGYLSLEADNVVTYKCSGLYKPSDEAGINWRDPDLKISWPSFEPMIKERDANFPFLRDIGRSSLPQI